MPLARSVFSDEKLNAKFCCLFVIFFISPPFLWTETDKEVKGLFLCILFCFYQGARGDRIWGISFHFFFSVATFSHRRRARIKKLILRKWLEMANNLGLDPFPDPVGHFGAPWWPFGLRRWLCKQKVARIKKLI